MQREMALTGEQSDHKVAGSTNDHEAAEFALEKLRRKLSLDESDVELLTPADQDINRSLEPESKGIWHTLIRSHLWLGGLGGLIGLLVFGLMYQLDVPFVVGNAMAAASLLLGFGIVGGMLLGGALTLRPDHAPFLVAARAALRAGRIVVVVHARTLEQRRQAEEILDQAGLETVATL